MSDLAPTSPKSWRISECWVNNQRAFYRKSTLDPEYVERLNAVSSDWDPAKSRWEEMFKRLLAYKDDNGDCNVLRSYSDECFHNHSSKARTHELPSVFLLVDLVSVYEL